MKLLLLPIFSCINLRVGADVAKDESHGDCQFSGESRTCRSTPLSDPDDGCALYLAESSIPNAGLGVYTGVNVNASGVVTEYDLPIQVTDLNAHAGNIDFLLDNYHWTATMTGGHYDGHSVSSVLPSFGMMPNGHMGLHNVNSKRNEDDDLFVFHRSKDPGAGAVSAYHTMSWSASKFIAEGSEIFLDYGESYWITREHKYGPIPLSENFKEADVLLKRFNEFARGKNKNRVQDMWSLARNLTKPRTNVILPLDVTSLDEAEAVGTSLYSIPNAVRSLEWLRQNGQCMDNLVVKLSALPQAGRGAYAKRYLARGSLIAPAPLVQIVDRDQLNMYELIPEDPTLKKDDVVIGKQLILNYCYGHANSSILLFPYSPVVNFINHDGREPNAAIRWSNHSHHHSDWMDISPKDIRVEHAGLMFDIIALKDISPGEEVVLDYGNDWESAWNKHLQEWAPVLDEYVHAHIFNRNNTSTIRTLKEQEEDGGAYPSNLMTGCYYTYNKHYKFTKVDGNNTRTVDTWKDWENKRLEDKSLRPCDILSKEMKHGYGYHYTAQIFNHGDHYDDDIIPDRVTHTVTNIPRKAIRFIEKNYGSNQFLKNAFREPIGIPDDMMPSAWLNL